MGKGINNETGENAVEKFWSQEITAFANDITRFRPSITLHYVNVFVALLQEWFKLSSALSIIL